MLFLLLFMSQQFLECGSERLGATLAVDGTGNNATGIACPLAAGIETIEGDVMEGFEVARDAQGGRCAGLDTDDNGIVGEETAGILSEYFKTLAQTIGDKRWHPQVQP